MRRLLAGIAVAGICTVGPLQSSLSHAASRQAGGSPTPAEIVATARAHLGDRYATIGNSPATGFSCIGFVNYVFGQNGIDVPFDIAAAWNSAPHVTMSDLLPGDVLFFSNTVFAGLSHVAIYIGNGQMIGADSFAVGVTTDRLGDSYWTAHYTGATRPLALVGTVPMPGSANAQRATSTPLPAPDPTSQSAAATATPAATQATTSAAPAGAFLRPLAVVTLYSGPGYRYMPVTTLGPSSVLAVLRSQADWYYVRFGGIYGWANAANLGPVGNYQTQAAPTATPVPAEPTAQPGFSRTGATASGAGGSIAYVADGPLTMRSGPGTAFLAIGYLARGTQLTVRDLRPDWAYVGTPSGTSGWVAVRYLSTTAPNRYTRTAQVRSTPPAATGTTVRVTASILNVRTQPNGRARVLTVLFAGETVQMLAHRTGWDLVRMANGMTGWASAAWLAAVQRCAGPAGRCADGNR